jgi:hypothetical protein
MAFINGGVGTGKTKVLLSTVAEAVARDKRVCSITFICSLLQVLIVTHSQSSAETMQLLYSSKGSSHLLDFTGGVQLKITTTTHNHGRSTVVCERVLLNLEYTKL